jgi:hypothetical protein
MKLHVTSAKFYYIFQIYVKNNSDSKLKLRLKEVNCC